jgi:hypothetical protein
MPEPVPRWEISHNMNIKVSLFLQLAISKSSRTFKQPRRLRSFPGLKLHPVR